MNTLRASDSRRMRSLQSLCTASDNQARLDVRTEYKIWSTAEEGGWKLEAVVTQQLHYAIVPRQKC